MIEQLFGSKARAEILTLFFKEKGKKFYITEIARLTNSDPANIFRELKKLEKAGILCSVKEGAVKYYFADENSQLFEALTRLFFEYKKLTQEDWILIEEVPGYTPSTIYYPMAVSFVNKHYKSVDFDCKVTKVVSIWDKEMCGMWMIRGEFDKIINRLMNILINDPDWMRRYIDISMKKISSFKKEVDDLDNMNLLPLSDKELLKLHDYYQHNFGLIGVSAWIQAGVDYGDSLFSKHLMKILEGKIKNEKIKNISVGEAFAALTTPAEAGAITKEYQELQKIITNIRKDHKLETYFKRSDTRLIVKELPEISPQINQLLEKHVKKFGWIGYGMLGPSWGKDYFVDLIGSLLRQKTQKFLMTENKKTAEKIKYYEEKLNLSNSEKQVFAISRDLVSTKSIRKDFTFYYYSVIENLLREIGRRFYLSLNQVRYLYPSEINELLSTGKFNINQINARANYHVLVTTESSKKDLYIEGEQAEKYVNELELQVPEASDIKIILGDCACPGRIKGVVRIVNSSADMAKVTEGDILVSLVTNPDIVPAMKKAGAIVTDAGGITCHAAIVSRELNIPCVIGTKIATRSLHDGDIVDVDATHGKVMIIERAKGE
ncbi:MAG: PEP-utilizing enzyme [bacterium]